MSHTKNSGETQGRRAAVQKVAQRIVKDSKGKVSHAEARKKAIKHANRVDRKQGRG